MFWIFTYQKCPGYQDIPQKLLKKDDLASAFTMEKMSQSLPFINPRGACNIYARVGVNCTLICRVVTLVRVSITLKRHEDHGISYKGNQLIEVAAYSSDVQSITIKAVGMALFRLTWC